MRDEPDRISGANISIFKNPIKFLSGEILTCIDFFRTITSGVNNIRPPACPDIHFEPHRQLRLQIVTIRQKIIKTNHSRTDRHVSEIIFKERHFHITALFAAKRQDQYIALYYQTDIRNIITANRIIIVIKI